MSNTGKLIASILVYAFSGFVLYITKTASGLDTAAVALTAPLVTAVTVYYFQSDAVGHGAALSAAGATAAIAASAGQPTTIQTRHGFWGGGTGVRTGTAATIGVHDAA